MKKIFVLLLILISVESFAQGPVTYTLINQRYRWFAGIMDSGFIVPRFSTVPYIRTGTFNGAGNIGVDTVNHRFYYYSGSTWRYADVGGPTGTGWSLTGNSGTTAGTNFIGTTDGQSLVFKLNGTKWGRLDYTYGNIFFGQLAGNMSTTGNSNIFIGTSAGVMDSVGYSNVAIGTNSFSDNGDGNENTVIGNSAMTSNTTGNNNIAVGNNAGTYNTTVSNQLFINSISRTNYLDEKASSIIYGVQDLDASLQSLYLNSQVYTPYITNLSTQDRLIGQRAANSQIGYVTLGAGLSLSSGVLSSSTVATAVPLSGITAATGTNTIDNGDFQQLWQWNTLSQFGLTLFSNSTAATSGMTPLKIAIEGVNATSTVSTYGAYITNTKTGTSSTSTGIYAEANGAAITNIGGRFAASNATNNYAIIVPASSGSVGIGTATPAKILHTVGTVRHVSLGTASGDTTTYKPLGIDTNGDVFPMTYWPGGGSGGTPAGSTTEVQFNNAGAFGASNKLTWDNTNKALHSDYLNLGPTSTTWWPFYGDGKGYVRFPVDFNETIRNESGNWQITAGAGSFFNNGNTRFGSVSAATSTVQVTGSMAFNYTAQTGTYVILGTDYAINCTSGTFTATLPTAVGITGRQYFITNSGGGTITLATTSSQTFANVVATPTTLPLATLTGVVVMSDGANWLKVSSF